MSWRKIRPLILAVLAAFLVICVSGIAIANRENEIHIFKMGTDVIVPEQQVMTDVLVNLKIILTGILNRLVCPS